jgi:lipid II:glycine glycyltransferase (peptidoglycan interpeptide bridge formation enzyme)
LSRIKSLIPADPACCDGARSFLQSGFWGAFKARFGWIPHAFMVEWENSRAPLLVMRRRLGPLSFAYVPWGPELDASPEDRNIALTELAGGLKSFLPADTAFIRFDPPWYGREAPPPPEKPFFRAAADIQPPDTVLIDLRPSVEGLLDGMKPKWRYNIRLAEKKGVAVRRLDEEGLPVFYRLFQETSVRDGIALHNAAYYQTLFSLNRDYAGGGQTLGLYVAEHEGEALAAVIVLFRGVQAHYLYGASANHKRNLMAPYALQWRAMLDAKTAGCVEYDLFGIPPSDDPSHPMAGLYRFKTGFGGRIVHRPGSWDYPYRPAARLFHAAEWARKKLRDRKKRRAAFSERSERR